MQTLEIKLQKIILGDASRLAVYQYIFKLETRDYIIMAKLILLMPRDGFFLIKILSYVFPYFRAYDLQMSCSDDVVIAVDLSESVFFPLVKYGYYKH